MGRIRTLPAAATGQFGPDHTVVEVITPAEWEQADPFILLMDDRVDGTLRAGPHPHAGFETVTFLVDGGMGSEHRGEDALAPGDVEWTTAGSGIVHGPDAPIAGRMRALQLWLTLPKAQRWTDPDHQLIRREAALLRREPGAEVRLYSGHSGSLQSTTRNRVPVTLADIRLEPGAEVTQEVPDSYNGFLYVLAGTARIGAERLTLEAGQVGWLDRRAGDGQGTLRLTNPSTTPLRVLLYAGQRQGIPLTWHGPFIGDTRADIVRSFERYQAGTFVRV